MSRGRVIGLGIGIFLIAAAFGIVLWQGINTTNNVAFAQTVATATPAPTSSAPSAAPQQQTAPTQPSIGDTFWTQLAAKLGVNADTLKKQAVETRQAMIDQAVKDGRITQEQGDALKLRITSDNIIAPIQLPRTGQMPNMQPGNQNQPGNPNQPGRGFGPFNNPGNNNKQNPAPFFGNGARGMMQGGLEEIQAIATVLKLEPQALLQQMAQGKTLADIAKAQSVDEAKVKQAIIDARTTQIDQLLSYGMISQLQADQMKAQLTADKIDLTRPFMQFHNFQFAPKSSQGMPNFGMGQTFGMNEDDMQMFGQMFGMDPQNMPDFGGMFDSDGNFVVPQGDPQTN